MNETEPKDKTPSAEIEEYQAPKLNISKDIALKLEESGKKYPIYNPANIGDVVGGLIEEIEYLEHLNEDNGGWLIRVMDDNNNKFVMFPNVVLTKKLLVLCPERDMIELKGMYIYVQYDGEQQPKNPKMKPYKTYTVVKG